MNIDNNEEVIELIKLSLPAYVAILESKNWTKTQIATSIGVTPYQIYLYGNGKTKRPRAVICMNIYNGVKLEGKNVLIDLYSSYEDLKSHYDIEVAND